MYIQNKYSVDFTLTTADVDLAERWSISGIMNAIQLAADHHATSLGVGKDQIYPRGYYWVLARLRINMRRYPRHGDTITATTWPGAPERIAFPRYFKFEDENGELGSASILYMLMSAETHRFVPSAKVDIYPKDMQIYPETYPAPEKIRFDETNRKTAFRKPVYSDIDLNRHMNNTRYAQWICDLFPTSKFVNNVIKTCGINFVSDGIEGHSIALELCEQADIFTVRGTDTDNENKTVFECSGEWIHIANSALYAY